MFTVYAIWYDGREESFEFDNIHEARIYAQQDCVNAIYADVLNADTEIIESYREGCLV